jgi:hypothetical protein
MQNSGARLQFRYAPAKHSKLEWLVYAPGGVILVWGLWLLLA